MPIFFNGYNPLQLFLVLIDIRDTPGKIFWASVIVIIALSLGLVYGLKKSSSGQASGEAPIPSFTIAEKTSILNTIKEDFSNFQKSNGNDIEGEPLITDSLDIITKKKISGVCVLIKLILNTDITNLVDTPNKTATMVSEFTNTYKNKYYQSFIDTI